MICAGDKNTEHKQAIAAHSISSHTSTHPRVPVNAKLRPPSSATEIQPVVFATTNNSTTTSQGPEKQHRNAAGLGRERAKARKTERGLEVLQIKSG